MRELEGSLRCEACGAVWKSPAAHQIAMRDGKCLRCGKGPLVDERTGDASAEAWQADDDVPAGNDG